MPAGRCWSRRSTSPRPRSATQVALITEGRLVALGAARTSSGASALGGDLLEVETKAPFDPEQLAGRPHILRVETRGLRSFWAAVDDGPQMLPVIDDLVAEAGGEVVSARAITPSFDEVFAALVRRERGSTTADEAGRAADAAAERRCRVR